MTARSRLRLPWPLICLMLLATMTLASASAPEPLARSVILMIGDGMGPLQVELAELHNGQPLMMQTLPVRAALSTRAANNATTDSAAAATALATGYKTNNGMIGITPDGRAKTTILEAAKAAGKASGTITTTHPGHATPAAFVAHVVSRSLEQDLVLQAMSVGQDVVMGGGRSLFLPQTLGGSREDGRNLIEEASAQGYQYVMNTAELAKAGPGKLLGLFSDGQVLAYDIDRHSTEEPSLAEMTQKALQVLHSSPRGFFLMVEGGKIDTSGHDNDAATNVREVLAFDAAIEVAMDYVRKNPDTLLVVTADHETGGLDFSGSVNTSFLGGVKASAALIAKELLANRPQIDQIMASYTGLTDLATTETAIVKIVSNEKTIRGAVATAINRRVGISWSTTGHTATNVPLFAYGAGSELFQGSVYPNTDVPRRIAQTLGVVLD